MQISQIKDTLIKSFVVLGPIGNLLPVGNNIHAFRLFYLLLPIGIVIFLFNLKKNSNALRLISIFIPLIIYTIISALFTAIFSTSMTIDSENPILRLVLLSSLFLFVLLASDTVRNYSEEEKLRMIYLYIIGYLISLFFGYVMFIGYYLDIFSFEFLEKFHVLLQTGYGLLRFSPGSYPNEYGIVSSFVLSILTLFMIEKQKDRNILSKSLENKKILYIIFTLTLIALFLTTTRAAYIAYVISLIYISCKQAKPIGIAKRLMKIILVGITIFSICQFYVYDILAVISIGYESLSDENASLYERFNAWESAQISFEDNYLFGLGFGLANGIHNTYLQFIFEAGIIGIILVIFSGFLLIASDIKKHKKEKLYFLSAIKNIGLIHVSWFAMSNHNLNHHLTWFCILLYLACWNKARLSK